jgi:hypothetical protein
MRTHIGFRPITLTIGLVETASNKELADIIIPVA